MSAMLSSGPPPDSSSETPNPNPILKHVSWGPCSPPAGDLVPESIPSQRPPTRKYQDLGWVWGAQLGDNGSVRRARECYDWGLGI